MNEGHGALIARELSLRPAQVSATAALLDEGATVPFIARYRKEATGSLDEVAITAIRDRLAQLAELDARRAAILKSLRGAQPARPTTCAPRSRPPRRWPRSRTSTSPSGPSAAPGRRSPGSGGSSRWR